MKSGFPYIIVRKNALVLAGIFILIFLPETYAQQKAEIDLKTALQTAEKQNLTLKSAKENIKFAKGSLKERMYPQNTQIGIDYEESGDDFGDRIYYVQQQIEFPLRYYFAYRAGSAGINLAEANYKKIAADIKADVRNAYLLWLQSFSKVRIAENNLAVAQEFRKQTERLFKAGEVGRIVFSRSKISLSQAELNLQMAKNQEITNRNNLLNLLNMASGTQIEPKDSLSGLVQVDRQKFTGAYDSAKTTYLAYMESQMKQNQRELSFARSGYLPDITLKYFRFANNTGAAGFGFGLGIPLFFPSQMGTVQKAKANLEISRYQLEQVKLQLAHTTNTLQTINNQYATQLQSYETLAEESKQILDDSRRAYEAGELSYIEFLDAQQAFLQSNNMLIDVQYQYLGSFTNLYKLNGDF
ncbi:MAG: TolC family protein [Bacteroidia bacterium]